MRLPVLILLLALTGCGTPKEWARCTGHDITGRCVEWEIGRIDAGKVMKPL